MFVSQILTQVRGDFAARCAEIVSRAVRNPDHARRGPAAMKFYLHGFHDTEDPSDALSTVAHRADLIGDRFCLPLRNPFSLPGGRTPTVSCPTTSTRRPE